jgi:SAM-dependent methyltransferase
VLAFMSLQDMDDLPGAVREAARVLEPGGRLCFAIVHPRASAGRFLDDDEVGSPFVIDGSYLDASYYSDRFERAGLSMEIVSAHRPLQEYAGALAAAGFVIELLREPPGPEGAVDQARGLRWRRIPIFLYVRAVLRAA